MEPVSSTKDGGKYGNGNGRDNCGSLLMDLVVITEWGDADTRN